MSGHVAPLRTYLAVFGALLALTGITVWAALLDLGPMNTVVAMAIALFKALLVVLWFMHVRWSSRVTRMFVVAGLFWLALLIGLTLADYDSRPWLGG